MARSDSNSATSNFSSSEGVAAFLRASINDQISGSVVRSGNSSQSEDVCQMRLPYQRPESRWPGATVTALRAISVAVRALQHF